MTQPVVLPLPGNEALASALAEGLAGERGLLETHGFPDGESLVRVGTGVVDRDVVLACTLDRPDPKIVPLLLAAGTARELGARRVVLAAPHLAYLRQDARFNAGEAISARLFGRLLGDWFDGVVAVEPHLHRIHSLEDVVPRPCVAVRVPDAIAAWIGAHVAHPIVVGPDEESAPWASAVAECLGVPWVTLVKKRHGDRHVSIEAPDLRSHAGRMPVLVDDIISTGHTMADAVRALEAAGLPHARCIAVHAVVADGACEVLAAAGSAGLVTTNTLQHESNDIDIHPAVARGVADLLARLEAMPS